MSFEDDRHLNIYSLREYFHISPWTLGDISRHCPPNQPPLLIGASIQDYSHHLADPNHLYHSFYLDPHDLDILVPACAMKDLETEFATPARPSRSFPGLKVIDISSEKLHRQRKEWGLHDSSPLQILCVPEGFAPLEFFQSIALPTESTYGAISPDGEVQISQLPVDSNPASQIESLAARPLFAAKTLIRHSLKDLSPNSSEVSLAQLSDKLFSQIDWTHLTPLEIESLTDFAYKFFARHFCQNRAEVGGSILRKGSFKLIIEPILVADHMPDAVRLNLLLHIYSTVTQYLIDHPRRTPALQNLLDKIYRGHFTQITPAELVDGMAYLAHNFSGTDFTDQQETPLSSHSEEREYHLAKRLIPDRPYEVNARQVVWDLPWPPTHASMRRCIDA